MARQNNYPIFENNSTVITAEFLNGLVNNVKTLNQEDGVFDISIANAVSGVPITYNSLELALSGTSIPVDVRKGGMAVKFINSTTNKYEQWNLKASSWSTNTSDWALDADGSVTNGKLKFPFELEKPSSNEYVTQASQIGYNDRPLDETVDDIKDVTDHQKTKELDTYYICDSNGNAIAKFYAQGLQTTNVKAERFYNKDGNTLAICDGNGNVIAEVNGTGLSTTNVKAGKFADIQSDTLCICDKRGNVVGEFNGTGLDLVGLRLLVNGNLVDILTLIEGGGGGGGGTGNAINEWEGKIIAFYGDSVTAICNGNFQAPYTSSQITQSWGNRIAAHLKFSKCYGRGIGAQRFSWHENSGSVSWLRPDGTFIGRNDNFSYDNFDGESYPTGVTSEMELAGTAIRVRGCGCSWLRITKTFPADIKDTIHVVSIMYHNDAGAADTAAEWVANDTTDTEWAASSYYSTYGGDYNINTIKGGIASIVMKIQAWMPNAVIVLCTPISGNGTTGQLNPSLTTDNNMRKLADMVREMSRIMHIPCIDVNCNDGINGLNRTRYIKDTIHPYLADGKKMIARAIIGGLKTILPNFD